MQVRTAQLMMQYPRRLGLDRGQFLKFFYAQFVQGLSVAFQDNHQPAG
jgi:hypothetical protein